MVKLWLNYGFTTSDPKRHKLWFIYGLTMAQLWFNYDSTMVKLWLNYARQKNTGHVFGDAAFFAPKSHKNHFRFPTCVLCFGWYSFRFPGHLHRIPSCRFAGWCPSGLLGVGLGCPGWARQRVGRGRVRPGARRDMGGARCWAGPPVRCVAGCWWLCVFVLIWCRLCGSWPSRAGADRACLGFVPLRCGLYCAFKCSSKQVVSHDRNTVPDL